MREAVSPSTTVTDPDPASDVPGTFAETPTFPGRATTTYCPDAASDIATNGVESVLTSARTGPAVEDVVPATYPSATADR